MTSVVRSASMAGVVTMREWFVYLTWVSFLTGLGAVSIGLISACSYSGDCPVLRFYVVMLIFLIALIGFSYWVLLTVYPPIKPGPGNEGDPP